MMWMSGIGKAIPEPGTDESELCDQRSRHE